MKDQYVGDVNDFLKYALLRSVCSAGHSVYVAWMLTPPDGRTDGIRTAYLSQPERYRQIDPPLFDGLSTLVVSGQRSVQAVERTGLVPSVGSMTQLVPDQREARERHLAAVLDDARRADVIFFDPDNGLETRSVAMGRLGSSKYLYWNELARTYASGHSVVIYQHFPRRARQAFLEELGDRIHATTMKATVLAVSTSHVAFLVAARPSHAEGIESALMSFAERASSHASVISLPR